MAVLGPARNQKRPGRGLECRPGVLWIAWLALVLPFFQHSEARAQSASHEYALKAVFLLNFARFTDWPAQALQGTNSPFVIGIVGGNPFGPLMEETVRGEEIHHHRFVVQYYHDARDIKNCEILFISKPESGDIDRIMADVKNKPVLTVADFDDAAKRGVCVQFKTESNKIHLLINLNSLEAAHLDMSSELLQLADIVSSPHK